ncbi:MAG: fucose-binding protein [Hyphomicrobiales bacterium]|nr:fucose-binding protein [Hyphomicrobiales bacterium]
MLIGIDPVLDAELLYVLRAMGHGDTLAVVDANYPAATTANHTLRRGPIVLNGVDAPRAIAAILSVMPIDTFVPDPVARMEVVGDPNALPPVQREVQAVVDRAFGKPLPLAGVERMAFYQKAQSAFAVVATSERRHYGCFLIKKGVVPE